MNDREMLEMAAKAAGYEIDEDWQRERDEAGYGHRGLWIAEVSTGWNPLTDDGHALRLAVALSLRVYVYSDGGDDYTVVAGDELRSKGFHVSESHHGNPFSATRRAIVRAAAEIGRARP